MEAESFDKALEYCLENPDKLSNTELLGMFPQYREELEPVLGLDRQLLHALPAGMPPESKAAVRQRLLARVAPAQEGRAQAATNVDRPVTGIPATRQGDASRIIRWPRRLVAGIAAIILLLLLWGSASTSLPGNPLYGVKLGTENLLLNLAGSQPALIRGHLNLGNVRLVDVRTLENRHAAGQAGPAVDNYQYHIRSSLDLWQVEHDDKDLDLARLLYASSVAGQRVLTALGEGTGQTLPTELQKNVGDTMTALESLQSSSAGVLRAGGIDLDQALREAGGTVGSLLQSTPEAGTGGPTPTVLAGATTPTPSVGQAAETTNVPSLPTLTAVVYAAQTMIAAGDSSNTAGIAAAETVIAGGGDTTPLSTPLANAIKTVLAQPTPVLSVEPRITGTAIPGTAVLSTAQPILTALPKTAIPVPATGLPTTRVPAPGLTPSVAVKLPTPSISLPTPTLAPLATLTAIVPLPPAANVATPAPGAGATGNAGVPPTPAGPVPAPKLP